jgi:hypothetical protein
LWVWAGIFYVDEKEESVVGYSVMVKEDAYEKENASIYFVNIYGFKGRTSKGGSDYFNERTYSGRNGIIWSG